MSIRQSGRILAALMLLAVAAPAWGQGETQPRSIQAHDERLRGVVYPSKRVELTAPLDAIVDSIEVREMDFVKEGAVLIQMDNKVRLSEVLIAELELKHRIAQRDEAKQNYDDTKVLFGRNRAAGEVELRRAELNLNTAQMAIDVAEAKVGAQRVLLDQHRILAPFDGEILRIDAEKGARLNRGDVALTFVSRDPLEAHMNLPEELMNELRVGQTYTFMAERPIGRQLEGTLKIIEPQLEFVSSSFRAVFTIENPDTQLPTGFRVRLIWPQPEIAQAE